MKQEEVTPAFLFETIGELFTENKLMRLKVMELQKEALVLKEEKKQPPEG